MPSKAVPPNKNVNGRVPGKLYVVPDPQKRLYVEGEGMGGWVVITAGDNTLCGDTVQHGLFWEKEHAELFKRALESGRWHGEWR